MKLEEIKSFFQGRTGRLTLAVFVLVFLLFILFAWSTLFQLFKKQPPPKPILTPRATVEPIGPPRKITQETKVEFTGEHIAFPSQASIFSYLRSPSVSIGQAKALAQKLGFEGEPSPGDLPSWKRSPDSLQFDLKDSRLVFIRSPYLDSELFQGPSPKVQDAQQKAREFVETIGLSNFLALDNPEVSYSKYIGGYFTPADPSLANVITFTFRGRIGDTQVVASDSKMQLAQVRVGPKNTIAKAEVDLANYSYKTERVVVLPLFKESLDEISSGKGVVFEAVSTSEFPQEGVPLSEKAFREITLSRAAFSYFLSTKEGIIYPAGLFKGRGTTTDGKVENITIVLPLSSLN